MRTTSASISNLSNYASTCERVYTSKIKESLVKPDDIAYRQLNFWDNTMFSFDLIHIFRVFLIYQCFVNINDLLILLKKIIKNETIHLCLK